MDDEFCRLAVLRYDGEDGPHQWSAAEALRHTDTLEAAATAGDPDAVGRLLPGDATAALHQLVYARVRQDDPVAVADLLLAAGADPNAGAPWTPVTGVLGNGEQGPTRQPRHPHWRELLERLLKAGADPCDEQALYNTMFGGATDHLEVLFAHGLGSRPEHRGPLRILLRWAVEHDQRPRVACLAAHGVDVRAPFDHAGPPWARGDGQTPIALARQYGHTALAGDLLALGAEPPAPDPVADLIAAAFRGDASTVDNTPAEVVERARRERPGLLVWAAARGAREAVELLAARGFDVNAYGRGDAPVEEPWETALHQAAGNGDVALTRRLLDLGADPAARDRRFSATPLDWARHLQQPGTAELLGDG